MTSSPAPSLDRTSARARNESTFRASAIALYDGDIEQCLTYWSPEPRYAVAYPVRGLPPVIEGRDQFRAMFGGMAAAAERVEVTNVRLHQTDDPDVVFVEEHMTIDLHGGGTYVNDLVIRVTFRDGLIDEMFEYYGQAAHQSLAETLLAAAEGSA